MLFTVTTCFYYNNKFLKLIINILIVGKDWNEKLSSHFASQIESLHRYKPNSHVTLPEGISKENRNKIINDARIFSLDLTYFKLIFTIRRIWDRSQEMERVLWSLRVPTSWLNWLKFLVLSSRDYREPIHMKRSQSCL